MPLTVEQRKVMGEYVRVVADRMNFDSWTFHVMHDEPKGRSEHTAATVEKWYGRRVADIAFRGSIVDEPADVIRHMVVHELCHLPFEPQLTLLDNSIKDLIGMIAWDPFTEGHRLMHEEAIDHIATVLAPFMPEFPGWA